MVKRESFTHKVFREFAYQCTMQSPKRTQDALNTAIRESKLPVRKTNKLFIQLLDEARRQRAKTKRVDHLGKTRGQP